jgi:hypothetical protein
LAGNGHKPLANVIAICSSSDMHSITARLKKLSAPAARGLVPAVNNNRANNNANLWRACA